MENLALTVRDLMNLYIVRDMEKDEKKLRAMVELAAKFLDPPIPVEKILDTPWDLFVSGLLEVASRINTVAQEKKAIDFSKLNS